MKRFFISWIMIILCFSIVEAKWIVSEGSAPIENGNIAEAKKNALHDAERNAIERALGSMISSESLVENFVLIKDKILTKVEGYVKDLKILEEKCDVKRKECYIKIKADVEEIDLADDVAALVRILPKMNYPSIGIIIKASSYNQNMSRLPFDPSTAESVVISILRNKGFLIVEPSALEAEKLRQSILAEAVQGKLAKVIEDSSYRPRVLVIGEAFVQDAGAFPYNDKLHAYSAVINAKVFETSTGKLLASVQSKAGVPSHSFITGAHEALKKAAYKLGEKISKDIIKIWLDACYNSHPLNLIVENISYGSLPHLVGFLEGVRGVSSVYKKNFLRGRAEIIVNWHNCNSMGFANKIAGRRFSNYSIEVLEVSGNTVRVRINKVEM